MGLIRLFLALSVVAAHFNSSHWLKFAGGEVAVQSFFMLSGFYIAMILDSYESKAKFWTSRFLRLYPTYLFCALLSLLVGQKFYLFDQIAALPTAASIFIYFTNLTLLFQDLTMFLGVSGSDFYFTKNFMHSQPPLYQLLLLPQAWSLGLEISFYLLAPWILRRNKSLLILLILSSIFIRIALKYCGIKDDPWSYRFFPTELALFLVGSLMYYRHKEAPAMTSEKTNKYLLALVLIFIAAFTYMHMGFGLKKVLFYVLLAGTVGRIFELTKSNYWDNLLGLLSYPIYCSHLILLGLFKWAGDGGFLTTLGIFSLVAMFSYGIYVGIERPVDQYRKRFKGIGKAN